MRYCAYVTQNIYNIYTTYKKDRNGGETYTDILRWILQNDGEHNHMYINRPTVAEKRYVC